MKKKVLVTLATLSLATSVGFASPVNDFSQGKVAVDISARPSNDLDVSDSNGSAAYDGKTSWEYGENKYNKVKYNSIMAASLGSTADYTVKGIGYGVTYKF